MKCDDCKYLRRDVKVFGGAAELPAQYGKYTNPCDRYPQSIMRSPKEPACGEFKPKRPDSQSLLSERYWKYSDVIIGIVKQHKDNDHRIVASLKKEGIIAKCTYWVDVKFYKQLQEQLKKESEEESNDRTKPNNGPGGSQELPGQPGR